MRVLSAVGRSIMVQVTDVVSNDILFGLGDERDPIIERVEEIDGKVRFHYKDRPLRDIERQLGLGPITKSNWMEADGKVFIHDLKNERSEFTGEPAYIHKYVMETLEDILNDRT